MFAAMLWAMLTPLIVVIFRRYPINLTQWRKNIFIHISLSILLAPIHRFLSIFFDFAFRKLIGFKFFIDGVWSGIERVKLVIISSSVDSFMTYWLIILVLMGYQYYQSYKRSQIQASKLQTQLAKAQLDALKTQLQPHFLFNSMQAISTLMHRDKHLAEKAMAQLSDLLRQVFKKQEIQKIPLAEEIAFNQQYLQLQQLRFQDRLQLDFLIESETESALIPNLLLQPLFENAIKHGFESHHNGAKIQFIAKKEGQNLSLQIRDNGLGLSKSKNMERKGFGLSNTEKRLSTIYANQYQFEFGSNSPNGFFVYIQIPFENASSNQDHNR